MRRLLIGFFVGGLFGVAGGFALGIFFFPYIFPPPRADQQVADRAAHAVLATGRFVHADPTDIVHWGRGGVSLLKAPDGGRLIVLEQDFEVGPGPDFRVYLVRHPAPRAKDDVRTAFLDVGGLMSFAGSQIYRIAEDVDLQAYGSVVIWCRAFGQLISPATLAKAS
ncbi:MAG: DM13 domain-containing protein [Alphaproteobacteria bacterium]|nr:DM13 domain-containing protein [Alphaproteobacteria bacterium]